MGEKKNNLKELVRVIENLIPPKYALLDDKAGLLVGLSDSTVNKVLLAVECLDNVKKQNNK